MATFRKRNGIWQVQVRKKNIGTISKSFIRKTDGEVWARNQEILMQSGEWEKSQERKKTLGDLMKTYLEKVTPSKRSPEPEQRRLRRLLREKKLMETPLSEAGPPLFATYRDKRTLDGVRACQYDLVLFRHAWNIALIEWGWSMSENPLAKIRFPKNNPPRERRLRDGEFEKLRIAAEETKVNYLWPIINIAIETAMRRGEILGLTWDHIDERRQSAYLPITKNGRSRHVPLNTTTIEFIRKIPRDAEKLFPISDTACRQAWDRLRRRAGILDLTFHDLRHEAVSRMFEKGINMARVMAISGHRTPNQMFRYVQVDSI